MSQSVSEVFPNTPDPLNIESCGLLLCLPSSNENATSARVHCQRQWTGHSIRFSATHPLVLLHDTNRFNDTSLVLMADAWGTPPNNLSTAVQIERWTSSNLTAAAAMKDSSTRSLTKVTTLTNEPLAMLATYITW
eukprot:m.54567 g.54567  ORF g.54567 m.54567 type:complete len:135 (-) comp12880_c0_seq1:194-598(-)